MIKSFIAMLCLILSIQGAAQWSDNFSDSNSTLNPEWFGDTGKFTVNTGLQLQLNAPQETGDAYISTFSPALCNASWTFWTGMDFNPSTANYIKIFLTSGQAELNASNSGYVLRIGYTSDNVSLYRQEGTSQSLIAESNTLFTGSSVHARFKILHDTSKWTVLCDTSGQYNFVEVAQGTDHSMVTSQFFGIQCIYTSTRSHLFYFDDFEVNGASCAASSEPFIQSIKIKDAQHLAISLTTPVSTSSCTANHFRVNEELADSVHYIPLTCRVNLFFRTPFLCDMDNILSVSNLTLLSGAAARDTILPFRYCMAGIYDVVFNEIMADPDPPVALPEAEYLELYNRSNKMFNLEGWKLCVESDTFEMPAVQLSPDSYLLVCNSENQPGLSGYGPVLGLFTSPVTLSNNGTFLQLLNDKNHLICWTDYNDSWYKDDYKAKGGWSLEQIDPDNPCSGMDNWEASRSGTGGTPGSRNSVWAKNPDKTLPEVKKINVPNDTTIDIIFAEPMDSTLLCDCNTYNLSGGIGRPEKCIRTDKEFSTYRLFFVKPMVTKTVYTLSLSGKIQDCTGNSPDSQPAISVGMPSYPDSGDLIINEVLFNSFTGGADYVELYNRSGKIINAKHIIFSIRDGNQLQHLCRLSEAGFLIFPGTYSLLTSGLKKVEAFYHVENTRDAVELTEMPSLNDQSATLVLVNDTLGRIDAFTYSEDMQLDILKSKDGVSLERVNPDKPAWFPGNWHSAAESAGYGTPGYQNSQYLADTITPTHIFLSRKLFSPDNDGFHDLLQVNYKFDKPGCRVQAFVFTAAGHIMRHLFTNELLGTEGFFTWDGTDDQGQLCNVGMYLIYIRSVFPDGTTNHYKLACVLATRK